MVASSEKFSSTAHASHAGDYNYYWGRTVGELPHYFEDVTDNPLRPIGSITHIADGALRTTSDIVRLFQDPTTRRTIKPLGQRGRFVDSTIGTIQDGAGAIADIFRLKPISATGKAAGAVLSVGDIAMGFATDASDLLTGADTKHAQAA